MSTDTSVQGKNGGKGVDKGADVHGDEFVKVTLSRPQFRASECKGFIQGYFTGILGPFPPSESQKTQAKKNGGVAKPWCAYAVTLTAPCDVVVADGSHKRAEPGAEVMLPISAQLKAIIGMTIDPDKVTNLGSPRDRSRRPAKCVRGSASALRRLTAATSIRVSCRRRSSATRLRSLPQVATILKKYRSDENAPQARGAAQRGNRHEVGCCRRFPSFRTSRAALTRRT